MSKPFDGCNTARWKERISFLLPLSFPDLLVLSSILDEFSSYSSVLSNFISSLSESSVKLITLGTSSTAAASKAAYNHQPIQDSCPPCSHSILKPSNFLHSFCHSEQSYSSFICTDICHDKESQIQTTKVQYCMLFYQIMTSILL